MRDASPIELFIGRWPTREAFAAEVGANVDAVHKWARNGRIPPGWQSAAVRAAQARSISYATAEWMLDVHAKDLAPLRAAS